MSIPFDTPHYILAQKRSCGLIDFAVFNPRGYGKDDLIYKSFCAVSNEVQLKSRANNYLHSRQTSIGVVYINNLQEILDKY